MFGSIETMIIYGFLIVFSTGLFIVSILSFHKSKNQKLLFVSGIFLLFLLKSIILSLDLFIQEPLEFISIPFLSIFDLGAIILLFIATLKK